MGKNMLKIIAQLGNKKKQNKNKQTGKLENFEQHRCYY